MAGHKNGRKASLKAATVKGLEAEAERYIVWDTDPKTPGFGVQVTPNGVKTFLVRYRVGGGRRGRLRQMVIGRYGALTPDDARSRAISCLRRVADGEDPLAERIEKRAELTVSELCDLYLSEGVRHKKASTITLDRIRIERHIKPTIGKLKVSEVDHADIERMASAIETGKIRNEATPHTRGGKGAASRTVGLLSGIFKFAILRKMRTDNPTKGVRRPKDGKRERYLSPAELGRLGDALTVAAASGANPDHIAILRLLALTGARKNEVARLRWAEVDLENACLNLDDSKTGAKRVSLGAAALEVLTGVRRGNSAYVFYDRDQPDRPVRNLDWAWVKIRKEAGLADVRIHDLRHSFASVGLAGGASLILLGKLLGHADVKSTARYSHLAEDAAKAAADSISKTIAGAMSGKSGDVRPMKGGARG